MVKTLLEDGGRFYSIVWQGLEKELIPRDIRRYVQIAGVLEPISEKEGCTTRTKDNNEFQKLEYFLTAGINIGDAFEDLAKRIVEEGFPRGVYDLAFRAQADSKKNRRGGRVNQGIIEFLFPLVISQLVYKSKNPDDIIIKVPDILQQTTPEDTVWLQRMQNLAFEMSGYSERTFQIKKYPNISSYYRERASSSAKPSDYYHNNEIIDNYPTLRHMLILFETQYFEKPLSKSMKEIYDEIKNESPKIPKGILADLNACLIYLILSCNRTSKIVT